MALAQPKKEPDHSTPYVCRSTRSSYANRSRFRATGYPPTELEPDVAPDGAPAPGCSTTGSSEACMLAGLALKRRWQHARRAAGRPIDRPNLVMGVNTQVCWEKLANYWDVEARQVPMEGDRLHLTAPEAVARSPTSRHCGSWSATGSPTTWPIC